MMIKKALAKSGKKLVKAIKNISTSRTAKKLEFERRQKLEQEQREVAELLGALLAQKARLQEDAKCVDDNLSNEEYSSYEYFGGAACDCCCCRGCCSLVEYSELDENQRNENLENEMLH